MNSSTPSFQAANVAAIPAPSHDDTIEFTHFSFHYDSSPEVPVLQNLSLNAKHGESLAIVGAFGFGKSTRIVLLERFHVPAQGENLFRDTPL